MVQSKQQTYLNSPLDAFTIKTANFPLYLDLMDSLNPLDNLKCLDLLYFLDPLGSLDFFDLLDSFDPLDPLV